jgi:acetolactate synthase-1/2/3 large subunit
VAIVGVGALADAGAVRHLLEGRGLSVLTTYQAAGIVDSESDTAAGLFTNGASEQPLLDAADLILAIGLDPIEPIPAPWRSSAPVVAIHPVPLTDAYYEPAVTLTGPVGATLAAVLDGVRASTWPPGAGARHRERVRAALRQGARGFGPLDVVDAVVASRPPATTATVDAGAHFLAVMPMWPASTPLSILISNGLATMGYSLPAAIGAALARPGRPVVCLVGDGGLGMTLAELETVARLDLPITVVVFDDAGLSLIKIKQGDAHGGPPAVDYRPIDFAAVAHACGLAAETVDDAASLRRVLASGWDRPRLVAARIAPDHYAHLLAVTRGS